MIPTPTPTPTPTHAKSSPNETSRTQACGQDVYIHTQSICTKFSLQDGRLWVVDPTIWMHGGGDGSPWILDITELPTDRHLGWWGTMRDDDEMDEILFGGLQDLTVEVWMGGGGGNGTWFRGEHEHIYVDDIDGSRVKKGGSMERIYIHRISHCICPLLGNAWHLISSTFRHTISRQVGR